MEHSKSGFFVRAGAREAIDDTRSSPKKIHFHQSLMKSFAHAGGSITARLVEVCVLGQIL